LNYDIKNVLVIKNENGNMQEIEPFNWVRIKLCDEFAHSYGLDEPAYITGQVCSIQDDDHNILLQDSDKLMRNVYLSSIESIKKLK